MRRLALGFVIAALGLATEVRAEIALLSSGLTLKLESHRIEGESAVLLLEGGGEIRLPTSALRGVVPDEVVEEVAAKTATSRDVRSLAVEVARRHGLDPDLVVAVVGVESAFEPTAVSPKGARGLMQLMPETAAALGVEDSFDPAENLEGGVRHLVALLDLYGGDVVRALAAYNAGEGAVARHGGVPPYQETRAYVKRVLERYRRAKE